nr:small conductance calcium activated potassium [Hymenolepis microstoma]
MSSTLSPTLAAGLDTHGAVALLAASTRPRLIASMRKKTTKAHSSQEEVPATQRATTWASSFDSGSNAQSVNDEYSRCGPQKTEEIPAVPHTSKQSSLTNRPMTHRGSITPETVSGTKGYKLSTGECEEGMNMPASEKCCTEQENTEYQDEDTLNNTDMTRPKRPYYCQKAQQFRTSWRTQSVETPSSVANYGLAQDRSLTMVESQSDNESRSPGNGIGQERDAQMKVYLTRGSRNPVKTILVNHNANSAAANADRLRARRRRTFSNRNQWRSVQLSPSHDTEIDRRLNERSHNASLRESRESYVENRCNSKPPSNFGFKKPLFWKNRSGSPFFNSLASITDTTKMGQSTKSSEVGPTSILKAQVSNRPAEMKSDEDATCLEPIFTIRQRRIQAMRRHRSNYACHNVGYRLGRRKKMFQQRSLVSDYCLGFAILGILLMIVENELTSANVITKILMVLSFLRQFLAVYIYLGSFCYHDRSPTPPLVK